jgi:hypothetical protein
MSDESHTVISPRAYAWRKSPVIHPLENCSERFNADTLHDLFLGLELRRFLFALEALEFRRKLRREFRRHCFAGRQKAK